MKNKNWTRIGIIYGVLFLVYNLIVFMLFKAKSPVFWISYILVVVAFALHFLATYSSFKDSTVEMIFYGIPLVSIATYYLVAQVVVSLIFIFFQQGRSGTGLTKAAVLIQLIMLAIFIVVSIVALMGRDAAQAVSDDVRGKVLSHKTTLLDVDMIGAGAGSPELKKAIEKLSETIKYSDPMTSPVVADIDDLISQNVSALRSYTNNGQQAEAMETVDVLESLFAQRNQKLYINK